MQLSYLALLDEVGRGKWMTKGLQGSAFELLRSRARAAGTNPSTARRNIQFAAQPVGYRKLLDPVGREWRIATEAQHAYHFW